MSVISTTSTLRLPSLWTLCIIIALVISARADATSATVEQGARIFAQFVSYKVWNYGTTADIDEFWGCQEEGRKDAGIIPTEEVWMYLRYTYERLMNKSARSPTAEANALNGFHVDIDVVHHPVKGRGLVAKQPIQSGDVVYRPIYSVVFQTGEEFREYLQALPPYLICDVIMWSYVRFNEEMEPLICIDLDPSSMVNDCDTNNECTLVPAKGMGRYTGCHLELVAGRDIAEGEELAMNYDFSEGPGGWVPLGLQNPAEVDEYQSERVQRFYEQAAKMYESDEF